MHYVISYDIADDRLRAKTAKLLERHGCHRVQKSVFTFARAGKRALTALDQALHRLLDGQLLPDDSLLVFPMEGDTAALVLVFGNDLVRKNFSPLPMHIRK
jgi:CRISPR-associated endonuclease Cas2